MSVPRLFGRLGHGWQLSTKAGLLRTELPSQAPIVDAITQTDATPLVPLPRRALLYLPGNDERKVGCIMRSLQLMLKAAKAASLQVDCVCLDCEDSVALSKKEEARKTISKILSTNQFQSRDVAVRINPPRTDLAAADLTSLFSFPKLPDTLVVPKVNEPADLEWV